MTVINPDELRVELARRRIAVIAAIAELGDEICPLAVHDNTVWVVIEHIQKHNPGFDADAFRAFARAKLPKE